MRAGEGRVHTCLREKYDKLTDACRKEELKLAILQSQNTELMPNLASACKVPLTLTQTPVYRATP